MSRGLHFLVVGAQKAATTTLWQLLRGDPELWCPAGKEAPFLIEDVYDRGVDWHVASVVPDGGGARLLGTVNSYITQGAYGGILSAYLEYLPREQLHVELTSDLERDPGALVGRLHAFLGIARPWTRSITSRCATPFPCGTGP